VRHTRALMYVRGAFWIVVDRIETDRPREIAALWHFHPDCTVELDGREAATTDPGAGDLRIVPLGGMDWRVALVSGRETPDIQGWYSPHYNLKAPAPTAVYSARVPESTTFAWLLVPARGTPERAEAALMVDGEAARVRVIIAGRTSEASLPLSGDGPPRLIVERGASQK
jgi:hypothetical protein